MSKPEQALGELVEDVTLPLLAGGVASLDGLRGPRRGLVVVFWSSVCSHCVRYDGYLGDLAAAHPELALAVIASREGESASQLRAALDERGLSLSVLHDADRAVAHAWLVQQTPRAFLLDGERRLLYRGAIDNFKYPGDPELEPYLEQAIAAYLAGQEIARTETPSFGCPIESVYYQLKKPL